MAIILGQGMPQVVLHLPGDLKAPNSIPSISYNEKQKEKEKEKSHPLWRKGAMWQCKIVQPLWNSVWRLLKRLKINLLNDPAALLQVCT
jgi:hypothetical protein